MAPKEPTKYQLSSRLQYQNRTPPFLRRLQGKVPDEQEDEPLYYDDGSGRPPIPVRPASPERRNDDYGSANEDDADERPQVVVLKAGKHLTAEEAENEKRKAKGLSPLPTDDGELPMQVGEKQFRADMPAAKTKSMTSLSFSTSKEKLTLAPSKPKRKVITKDDGSAGEDDSGKKVHKKKRMKREGKGLLSFGEDV